MSNTSIPPGHVPLNTIVLPYSFMVKFKENIPPGFQAEFLAKVKTLCSKNPTAPTGEKLPGVTMEFNELFKGFGGQFHPNMVAEMRKEKLVDVIQDGVLDLCNFGPYLDQNTTSWGLADISRDLTDPTPPQQSKYHGSVLGGQGITIWILDGGLNNVVNELDSPRVQLEPWSSGGVIAKGTSEELLSAFSTGVRHGTNAAATAAGKTVGAAPKANVRAIKLADDVGMLPTAMIATGALEYIVKHEPNPHRAVINCSWAAFSSVDNFTRASIRTTIEKAISK